MKEIIDILEVIFVIALFAGSMLYMLYKLKRRFVDKKQFKMGTQFTSENLLMQFQNEEKKKAIEHVVYMRDEEEAENEDGEDKSRLGSKLQDGEKE
ncbi:hypothetical protein ACFL4T_11660 [candidate division KSB1 bacterium]